jgi:hypothetical protein
MPVTGHHFVTACALGLVLGACYQPSTESCRYACAANNACPDGLACNQQGMCAETEEAVCGDDLPGSTVSILVRDPQQNPVQGATVVFAGADGALVDELMTGADGIAATEMEPGGSATVIRPATPFGEVWVTTYLDLWPDARPISQHQPNPAMREVMVEWEAPGVSFTAFEVYASCGARGVPDGPTTAMIFVSEECTDIDVVVIARDPTAGQTPVAAVAGPISGSDVSIPAASWAPVRAVAGTVVNLPSNASSMSATLTGGRSSTLNGAYLSFGTLQPDGAIDPEWQAPQDVNLEAQLAFLQQGTDPTDFGAVLVYDRLAPGAAAYQRDLGDAFLPWFAAPTTDLAMRQITWPLEMPVGPTVAMPNVMDLHLKYARGAQKFRWNVIATGSRLDAPDSNTRSFALPEIPGDREFEPREGDVVEEDAAYFFLVAPESADGVREMMDARSTTMFGPLGLDQMMVSFRN